MDTILRDGEEELPWTGERYVPQVSGEIELEHLHRYALARDLARGKSVLDIACGEGYGSALLAEVAEHVTGVDVAEDAITHARTKYQRPNLEFRSGSCDRIPLPDASIDLAVSFETIEHHANHREMMTEIRRVLRLDGILIISSPDKYEYSDVPGYRNEFHVKELYLNEFDALLRTQFSNVGIFGQRIHYGSWVAPLSGKAETSAFATFRGGPRSIQKTPGVHRPVYFVALASNAALPEISAGLFEGDHAVAERDGQIANLNLSLVERDGQLASLNQAVAERDGQITDLTQAVAERDGQIASLKHVMTEQDAVVSSLSQALKDRDSRIAALSQAVADGDARLSLVYSSLGWKLLTRYRRFLERLLPNYCRRRRLYELTRKAGFVLARQGLIGLGRAFTAYLRRRKGGPTTRPAAIHLTLKVRAVESRKKSAAPLVSIVINAKGQDLKHDLLSQQITALRAQTINTWELVVLGLDEDAFMRVDGNSGGKEYGTLCGHPLAACRGTYLYSPLLDLAVLPPNWLEANVLSLEAQALLLTCSSFGGFPPDGHVFMSEDRQSIAHARRNMIFYHRDLASTTDCAFESASLLTHQHLAERKIIGRLLLWHGLTDYRDADRLISLTDLLKSGDESLKAFDGYLTFARSDTDAFIDVFPVDLLVDPLPTKSDKPFLLVHVPLLAVGGAEKLTYDLLSRLACHFSFVLFTTERLSEELGSTHAMFRRLGATIYDLGEYAVPPIQFSMVSYLIKKYDPAALFVANGSTFFYDSLPAIRASFPRLRIVNQLFDHEAGWITRYTPQVCEDVDVHIACNRKIQRAYVDRLGISESKIAYIEHGINLDDFSAPGCSLESKLGYRAKFALPQDRIIVCFVARMHPQKRPHDFLKLAKRLERDSRFYFVMVGDGPLRENINDFIQFYQLNNFKKIGFYTPVTDVFAAADILVVTSEYEALPLVVLNALAMSVAVVSTDVGSIGDVLSRDGAGIVVKAIGNVDLLADAVLQAAARLDDLRCKGPKTVHEAHDIRDRARDYMRIFVGGAVEGP